jgi:hypothetical protein
MNNRRERAGYAYSGADKMSALPGNMFIDAIGE